MEAVKYPEHLVFGLDIGTRSIVGTVGYKESGNCFKVVAQETKLHETRAMIDGQIHDINMVTESIRYVKNSLEAKLGRKLNDVCIAAAGRVLKTLTVRVEHEFPDETVMTDEHIHSLELLAVEKAYDILREENSEADKNLLNFYCVGYSVIRYFLNGYAILKLEGHKALKVGTELIATFLPEEVVDGLYAAVEKAGLYVSNLTLEPIAAIQVAIPENFRLLNIALVDVGAGTSDISITKDGSIIAFGMMPFAGDEITEQIARKYLVDFAAAEIIKMACVNKKSVSFKDIMGIKHKLMTEEVIETTKETVKMITNSIADKIIELNGEKPVSAVFIVGGGGKIPGFTGYMAEYLGIAPDRVALRGREVLQDIEFLEPGIKKDSMLVTPVGICLNFYEQRNNFILVQVNGERIKLYDNNKLTIVDAAVQTGIANEVLFPRRGRPLNFTVNGEKRMIRGESGEAAVIKLNGKIAGINTQIVQNDKIEIIESTTGPDAYYEIRQLPEYNGIITFVFDGKQIVCPKFVEANGKLVSEFYSIQEKDQIQILNYYTLGQVMEFMDVAYQGQLYVNHAVAGMDEKVYENFTIDCEIHTETVEETFAAAEVQSQEIIENVHLENIMVTINGTPVMLRNKKSYILVDILDFYPIDINKGKDKKLVIMKNGQRSDFTQEVWEGDTIDIDWEE